MTEHALIFPDGFDDYAWELEAKGCFSEARLFLSGKYYRLNFYDPVRLGQEIESELARGVFFFESNLVVLEVVTRPNMEKAVEELVKSNNIKLLTDE